MAWKIVGSDLYMAEEDFDLWRHSGLMPWDSAFAAVAYPSGDTVHPNDVGHQIIAPKFKAFLETLLMYRHYAPTKYQALILNSPV